MQQRIIPPPGYNQEHKPSPSEEEILMAQNLGLSNWWEHYGDLLARSDWNNAENKAKAAYTKSAKYLRKVIEFAETQLDLRPLR